jgi:hypothetical protein
MLKVVEDLDVAVDRRVFERFYLEFSGRLREPGSQRTILIICQDISAQGIGIITGFALKAGDNLELWLDIPDAHLPLHLSGKVVWSTESEPGIWRVGVCFEQVQLTKLHRIFEPR